MGCGLWFPLSLRPPGGYCPDGPALIAFIDLSASQKGRYQTRWTNLVIHDLR